MPRCDGIPKVNVIYREVFCGSIFCWYYEDVCTISWQSSTIVLHGFVPQRCWQVFMWWGERSNTPQCYSRVICSDPVHQWNPTGVYVWIACWCKYTCKFTHSICTIGIQADCKNVLCRKLGDISDKILFKKTKKRQSEMIRMGFVYGVLRSNQIIQYKHRFEISKLECSV